MPLKKFIVAQQQLYNTYMRNGRVNTLQVDEQIVFKKSAKSTIWRIEIHMHESYTIIVAPILQQQQQQQRQQKRQQHQQNYD